MNFSHHEFMGRAECRDCRRPNSTEYRVQDARGNRIGRCIVSYACRCDPNEETRASSSECSCKHCNYTETEHA